MKFNIAVTKNWELNKNEYDNLIKLGFQRQVKSFWEYAVESELDGDPVQVEINTLEELIELTRNNGGSVIVQTNYYDDSDTLRLEIYNDWRE